MTNKTDNDFIGYAEAAELLGVPRGTLYSLVHRRRIPHFRLSSRWVRFSQPELISWMSNHQVAEKTFEADAGRSA